MSGGPFPAVGVVALAVVLTVAVPEPGRASDGLCVDCLRVRVGPPVVVRGPFPDELDAPFTALKLTDGSFRGFSANGTTYAINGATLQDMDGPRLAVLQPGERGSRSECGRWLTSIARSADKLLGLVHQERDCDYDQGRTDKSMAIESSSDGGLTWTDLGTVIAGRDSPQRNATSGEGDCTMADGGDGYLYAYCLRASDWQTIVARAPADGDPTAWHKFYQGTWSEPGVGGNATAIGFVGPGVGYVPGPGWVAAVTIDPWFGGVRLSLSTDKVTFVDVPQPLVTIDAADWHRPADTDLIAYATALNRETGSNAIDWRFVLSYVYVPPRKGFDSRYLVEQEVSLSLEQAPVAVPAGVALTRWSVPGQQLYLASTGPLTGDELAYRQDAVVAYMLTSAPVGVPNIKFAECSSDADGHVDWELAEEGSCDAGYVRERTAGWLYGDARPQTVPVYRCSKEASRVHFASSAPDCEGMGRADRLLGYGLAP